jgi:hypothetical protein
MLLVVLPLFLLWIGVSLIRPPRKTFLDMEEAEPRTLVWWDAYLAGWGFLLLALLCVGCGFLLLLALLNILPMNPSS